MTLISNPFRRLKNHEERLRGLSESDSLEHNSKQKNHRQTAQKSGLINAKGNYSPTTESEIIAVSLVTLTALSFKAIGIAANDLGYAVSDCIACTVSAMWIYVLFEST